MRISKDVQHVKDLLRQEYQRQETANVPRISTDQVADAVYAQLDRDERTTPLAVQDLARETLRRFSRKVAAEENRKAGNRRVRISRERSRDQLQ